MKGGYACCSLSLVLVDFLLVALLNSWVSNGFLYRLSLFYRQILNNYYQGAMDLKDSALKELGGNHGCHALTPGMCTT